MVPFDGFAYFAVLLLVLPAAVMLRLLTPTARAAMMATTIVMVAIQYGATSPMAGNAWLACRRQLPLRAVPVAARGRLAWLAKRRRASAGPPRRTSSARRFVWGDRAGASFRSLS